jgi:peptidoglycan/xylan/chitin deacetylase (PgdA/CDA1 family)/CelD/BcsL family acetyltransferase involved in cellulose biosynthesis
MNIVEIRQESGLYEMKDAWNRLLGESGSDSLFLTWEWISSWWRSYGIAGDLRILAAYDDSGILRGLAPLRLEAIRKYGQTYSALKFVGDGSMDSDYMDFIIASGWEDAVLHSFQRFLMTQREHDGLLLLNEVPGASPCVPVLQRLSHQNGWVFSQEDVPCSTVRLPKDWDAYLSILKPRFRTKVRSVLRNLESRSDVRFQFCEGSDQLDRLLSALFELHTMRWHQAGKPGVFGFPGKRDFYAAISGLFLDRNWLRFSWLEWNDRILACQYGFEYGGKYLQLQEGYEPNAEHWNVGVGLRAWSIQQFLKQGLREYDFLGGVTQHKTDWGSDTTYSKRILLAVPGWKNHLFVFGPEWESAAKDMIKKVVPDRIIEARQTPRPVARDASSHPVAPETSSSGLIRKLSAACYLRCGFSTLLRPLRNRYQISLGRSGRKRLSWTRRTEPSVRILYYHRVNNENDPFFPSMTTEQFENEIRYLARNYDIVDLPSALHHLHSGPPKPVVAITFDDGYQDNYQHAFPILQRHGVTATIFLTTDGLDSRQPLWFEQLAYAIKVTDRPFVDLEIDMPRRFRLDTPQNRLDANNRIFALLRRLRDPERTQWLTEIHRYLGITSHSNRTDNMLTWDQVRLMKSAGITFGGHTVTHPFISKLSSDRILWEASECKRRIEEELQSPVDLFAYPNGREEDFGSANKHLIRNAGYKAAVTTIWGTNYASTDPMELRRGGPWETSLDLFAYKLDWYHFVNE